MEQLRLISAGSLKVLLAVALVGAGCSGDPTIDSATIVSFSADPLALEAPGTTSLTWTTRNAVSISIVQDGVPLELGSEESSVETGSIARWLDRSAAFELILVGKHGE